MQRQLSVIRFRARGRELNDLSCTRWIRETPSRRRGFPSSRAHRPFLLRPRLFVRLFVCVSEAFAMLRAQCKRAGRQVLPGSDSWGTYIGEVWSSGKKARREFIHAFISSRAAHFCVTMPFRLFSPLLPSRLLLCDDSFVNERRNCRRESSDRTRPFPLRPVK